nr:hypothetical protein [Tanacetum cinerariifolium]GEY16370.1 hypothetical protein [Tanacetum cinerariifolium]
MRAERLACTANPLALVAQQQLVYHPYNHPNHYTQNSSTKSQQAAIRNKGKVIVNSPLPTNDQEPKMVAEDDTLLKEKVNQDNTPRINRSIGYDNQKAVNVAGVRENLGTQVVQQFGIQCYNCKEYGHVARECQKLKWAKDAAYHKEKLLLYDADNYGPIIDAEPLEKVQNNDDNYNVFAIESENHEQPESVNDTYLVEQDEHNIIINSLDMSYNREHNDQDDNDDHSKRT